MEALVRLLSEILDTDLPRVKGFSGDDTWQGPRADLVTIEFARLSRILLAAHDSATHHLATTGITGRTDGHRSHLLA